MATTTGKTIGLVLGIIVIIFVAIRLTPLIFAPFGWLTGAFHAVRVPNLNHFGPWYFGEFPSTILSLVLLILWIMVIVWVYRDSERRGMNGVLWALLVLIGNLIGLLIYLIVRSDNLAPTAPKSRRCPDCGRPVSPEHQFCSHCGKKIEKTCPECSHPVEAGWKACPHCGCKLES
jgi:hypothetical protein